MKDDRRSRIAIGRDHGSADDGSTSFAVVGIKRRRRRPLYFQTASFSIILSLLMATSTTLTSAAINDNNNNIKNSDKPPLLRHSTSNNNQRRRNLQYKNFCPTKQTGNFPTTNCGGYVSCKLGVQTSEGITTCASGTLYDYKSKTCTWPHLVQECKVGDELLPELTGKDANADSDEETKPPSLFCPPNYTGRAPTTDCLGYCDCISGIEGLSVNCPPRSFFDILTNQCTYNLYKCRMRVEQSSDTTNNEEEDVTSTLGLNELDRYCPIDYTGRAPLPECTGYIDCKNGKARRTKDCQGTTLFSVMKLACDDTMTSRDCDAIELFEPTLSPITREEMRADAKANFVNGCPASFTGYMVLPGCAHYMYCQGGVEVNTFKCAEGTLYNGSTCTWAHLVQCDTTAIPTYSPTEEPTFYPTVGPTIEPTSLDMDGPIYYPNFTRGICLNDGLYPSHVNKNYLFSNGNNCCTAYFPNNIEQCLIAVQPTPAPSPIAGAEWFPRYQDGTCINDKTQASPYEVNFFYTHEECCNFDWIPDVTYCLEHKPLYYPDYWNNICLNDGMQSVHETNVFDSYVECCLNGWVITDICLDAGGYNKNNGDNEEEQDEYYAELEGVEFYPDM